MDGIWQDLNSLRWWFTNGLWMLVMAVAAKYLIGWLDKQFKKIPPLIRSYSDHLRSRFQSRVALLSADSDLKLVFAQRENRHRWACAASLVFALLGGVIPATATYKPGNSADLWMFGAFVAAMFLQAGANYVAALRVAELVEAATPKLKSLNL